MDSASQSPFETSTVALDHTRPRLNARAADSDIEIERCSASSRPLECSIDGQRDELCWHAHSAHGDDDVLTTAGLVRHGNPALVRREREFGDDLAGLLVVRAEHWTSGPGRHREEPRSLSREDER